MAKTLERIQKEIAALERQAESIKQREVKDVIARIREAIAFYGLTATDLGLSGRGVRKARTRPAARKGKAAARTPGQVKYRDDAGHSWTGHGRRPQWFIDALASGKKPEDLAA